MLRGMGFDNTTSVYIAAGKIYKAEKYMAPLKQMFPRLQMKETLATSEELAPFQVPFESQELHFLAKYSINHVEHKQALAWDQWDIYYSLFAVGPFI